MTDHSQASLGHFTVDPEDHPLGSDNYRLVFTRVHDAPTTLDLRCHALRCAIDSESRAFRRGDDRDPTQDVLDAAAAFLSFLTDTSA